MPDITANFLDFVDALIAGEFENATARIHALKGVSQNADLTAVSDITLKIEESLRAGQSSYALESVAQLEEMVGATIIAIRRYLNG